VEKLTRRNANTWELGRRNLGVNIVVYVVLNALFVIGWLPNLGEPLPAGFFWPAIPMLAWGAGLVYYGYKVLRRDRRSDR
jgi:hypothetical protein